MDPENGRECMGWIHWLSIGSSALCFSVRMLLCIGKHSLRNWVRMTETSLYYKHDSRSDACSYGAGEVIMVEARKKERGIK